MADDDNVVLRLLREIREDVRNHGGRLANNFSKRQDLWCGSAAVSFFGMGKRAFGNRNDLV